jgi:TP901 family phage tail tape measure protein
MYAVDINLNDLFSSKFEQLKSNTLAGLNSLQDKLKSAFKFDMSGFSTARNSIDQLRQKIDTLTQNRNSATDFGIVKGLNKEISQAQKELQKLETMGTNTNPLTKLKNDAIMAVPALGLVANPIVASSLALSGATSMAANFEQGMAKINSTIQVSPPELEKIKNQLITLGKTSNVDLAQVPNAFEKIVSAVGDAGKSMEIFKSSLKASKAGFTDINIVADAGAAILANYNGMSSDYAMDVLMKTKNLGKAEFGDLAKYMPQILPDAKRLGISFEEMAGSFAYFTSKGISVEQTTTYLKNMMKPLGDPDKIANLEHLGVGIFELGEKGEKKMRPMTAIATDMNKAFGKMDAVKRLESFKKLEFDMEAGAGFSLLMQDVPKLTDMMRGMSGATGETDKTLQFTGNTIDNFTQASNQFKALFINLGDLVLPMVNTALFGVTASLDVLKSVFTTVQPLFQWFYDKSNLLIPVIGTLAGMYALWNFNMLASVATIGLLNGITMIFNGILAVTNFLMSINPVMLIVLGIMALGAALVYAYDTFEPFRNVVNSVFGEMSKMVNMVIEDVTWLITKIRDGLEWMGLLDKKSREQQEKAIADDRKVKLEGEKKQQEADTKAFSQGNGLFLLNTPKIEPVVQNPMDLGFLPKQKTEGEKLIKQLEEGKEKAKKEASILGRGNIHTAFADQEKYMTPEEKKALKGKTGKMSLGTFGVEGDTRQAKNITVNVQTLGGIKEIKIMVGNASEVTPELKQQINDGVREAVMSAVKDFETMY